MLLKGKPCTNKAVHTKGVPSQAFCYMKTPAPGSRWQGGVL
jgi:hypothetical protein